MEKLSMEEHNQWLKKAEDDLSWTNSNIKSGVWYGACFTAQQSAEKALKAFLIYHSKSLRKIHDLRALLEDCISIDAKFETLREIVVSLNPYYIETRYPSYEELDHFNKEEAQKAFEHARSILAFIKEKIL